MTTTAPRPGLADGAPAAPAPPRPRSRGKLRGAMFRWEHKSAPYVYVAPFFILFAAFGLFPLIYTAWVSLYSFKLNSEMTWVGLENYTWLFSNPKFYNALVKTITIGILSTVPQLLLALGLAHLLNYSMRARNFFRISMIMPYATSVAASTLVFAQIFARDGGVANWFLSIFGVDAIDWRNGDLSAQIAIAIIVTWRWTGYNALIYLAGMQSIPYELYEAASLDGASRWQQFRHVTLPGLRPTIIFTVIISTIGATQLFGEPLLFGGGQPNGGAVNQYQTLGLLMYQQGWQFGSLGRAAAIAWVTFALIVVLVLINTAFTRLRTRGREKGARS